MNHYTIVTEGEHDRLLLETLLDIAPVDSRIRVVAAGGWSAADSYARSLLMHNTENVALVVDADSNDPHLVENRKRFLRGSLGEISSTKERKVFVIAPAIEAILFHDRKALEDAAGHSLSDIELVRAEFEPKKVLLEVFKTKTLTEAYRAKLPDWDLSLIKRLPEIEELRRFLQESRELAGAGQGR